MKRGVTLIELVVAMAIFTTLSVLIISAFVTILNMKAITANNRETQQKLRVAVEQITRTARLANTISSNTSGTTKTLTLTFADANTKPVKFVIKSTADGYKLYSNDCSVGANLTCTTWNSDNDLLKGTMQLSADSDLTVDNNAGPKNRGLLNIFLHGTVSGGKTAYYKDDLVLKTSVILESQGSL
jgi:prepilin-type N-terminal cleavage/methylation domain-containing protein